MYMPFVGKSLILLSTPHCDYNYSTTTLSVTVIVRITTLRVRIATLRVRIVRITTLRQLA